MQLTPFLLGLVGLAPLSMVIAIPTTSPSSSCSTVIGFDQRNVIPGVPALNPVGTEKGVTFNSFVINQATTGTSGVAPHSPQNLIVTAIEQQAVNGTPFITPAAPYKTLDLCSFFFGIAANDGVGIVSAAIQGTILVAGFRGTQEVATATYTFSPKLGQNLPTSVPMIQAVLPDTFRNLTKVTFIQGNPTLQVLNVDDMAIGLRT